LNPETSRTRRHGGSRPELRDGRAQAFHLAARVGHDDHSACGDETWNPGQMRLRKPPNRRPQFPNVQTVLLAVFD